MWSKIKYMGLLCVLFCLTGSHVLAEEEASVRSVYHTHLGSGTSGGGCYVQHVKTVGDWGYVDCGSVDNSCGHNEMGPNVCNHQTWGYKEHKETYYTPDCGMAETTELARVSCSKDTIEWTRSLQLQAVVEILSEAVSLQETPYIWDQTPASESDVFTVEENGIHTLELQMNGAANTKEAIVQIEVDNIDNIPPDISEITWDKEKYREAVEVKVLAEDKASGLAEQAYSFDGGATWQTAPVCTLGNGMRELVVRDSLGNENRQSILIDNVDNEAPQIDSVSVSPEGWTNTDVTLSVNAADYQKDLQKEAGVYGSGLAEQAYSFDDGKNWESGKSCSVGENQDVFLAVRDRLGHVRRQRVYIGNIDKTAPHITLRQEPETWTEGSVVLNVSAYDEESGLDDCPFSWDGGKNWDYPADYAVEEAGEYQVMVRDKAGNIGTAAIDVGKKAVIQEEWELPVSPVKYRTPETEPAKTVKERKKKVQKDEVRKEEKKEKVTKKEEVRQEQPEKKTAVILREPERSDTDGWKWVLFGLLTAGSIVFLLLVLWYFIYRIRIENNSGEESARRRTWVHMYRGKRGIFCKIPKKIGENENYSTVRLIPCRLFLLLYKGKTLIIRTKEGEGELPVRAEMKIRLKAV